MDIKSIKADCGKYLAMSRSYVVVIEISGEVRVRWLTSVEVELYFMTTISKEMIMGDRKGKIPVAGLID